MAAPNHTVSFIALQIMQRRKYGGLTLLELIVIVLLLGILAALAHASYSGYIEKTKSNKAINEIMAMELSINAYAFSRDGIYPDNLAEVGLDGYTDPWGNPYRYLNIAQTGNIGQARKDRNLVPINSDYDLYSSGPDGRSVGPLTARHSRDDIVRANNGRFVGVAEDY